MFLTHFQKCFFRLLYLKEIAGATPKCHFFSKIFFVPILYCIVLWENVICFIKIKKSDFLKHLTQVFRQNLKPRLDKFSLYCFQIGIDHSFFYHSSSAIAIFHTTFQELFNRVIYFRLLKQKYAAIRAQT